MSGQVQQLSEAAAEDLPAAQLRRDYRQLQKIYQDTRTPDRLLAHFEVERRLAARLRHSTREERDAGLYTTLYDHLLRNVQDHPRHRRNARDIQAKAKRQVRFLLRRLNTSDVFLEIGAGDCEITAQIAPHVARAIAMDVSDELAPGTPPHPNFEFVKCKGVAIPLSDNSISYAYSNQLMEHLHPSDAADQVSEIIRVLKPGGVYYCRTPSRHTGPHDISMYFGYQAEGMHIQEYGYRELTAVFRAAKFTRVKAVLAPANYDFGGFPLGLASLMEAVVSRTPRNFRTLICRSPVVRAVMGVALIGIK